MKYYAFVITCIFAFLAAPAANASIVQWDLDHVTGVGGENFTGYVDYNTVTDSLSAWNIIGSGSINTHFSSGSSGLTSNTGQVGAGAFSFSYAVSGLHYSLELQGLPANDSIFNGTSNINVGPPPGAFGSPSTYFGSVGTDPTLFIRSDVDGSLAYAGVVPLPASLPLLLAAMIAMGLFAANRRKLAA